MGRRRTSVAGQLLEEARSIEVLLDELSPSTQVMEEYWKVSLELIDLVARIEELSKTPGIDGSSESYLSLRGRLSSIESRILSLERDVGEA